MEMCINFILQSDSSNIGHEVHTNIEEILIPSYSGSSHDLYLVKAFKEYTHTKHWKISSLSHQDSVVNITITPANSALSLFDLAKKNYKRAATYLRPFNIVEVDFSFHSDCLMSNGTTSQNKQNTSALLPGEIHKKRPCIVLSHHQNTVQVIPLSTSIKNAKKPKSIEISNNSFDNLGARYSNKTSYALIDMVQTVSIHRVSPPIEADGKYHYRYHQYKLTTEDKRNLVRVISKTYSPKDCEALASVNFLLTQAKTELRVLRDLRNKKNKEAKEALSKIDHL